MGGGSQAGQLSANNQRKDSISVCWCVGAAFCDVGAGKRDATACLDLLCLVDLESRNWGKAIQHFFTLGFFFFLLIVIIFFIIM